MLEKLKRDFIWHGGEDREKYQLVDSEPAILFMEYVASSIVPFA